MHTARTTAGECATLLRGSACSMPGRAGVSRWSAKPVFVIMGTPAWDAWQARWQREGRRPVTMKMFSIERRSETGAMQRGAWKDTLFPPRAEAGSDPPETRAEGAAYDPGF